MDHIPEELLERYSMGALPESETGPVEEHLLMCNVGQDRLRFSDAVVVMLHVLRSTGLSLIIGFALITAAAAWQHARLEDAQQTSTCCVTLLLKHHDVKL